MCIRDSSSGISSPMAVFMTRTLPSTVHDVIPGNHSGIDSGRLTTAQTSSGAAAMRSSCRSEATVPSFSLHNLVVRT